MQTIKNGSKGEDVKKWQGIISVTQDGSFGPDTESATKKWQSDHKLVPDGVVGPATWALALGIKTEIPKQKTPQAGSDSEAYAIAQRAGKGMTEREKQYVVTVARGEGFYGRGWGSPNDFTLDKSHAFGLSGFEGVGSNNWGAVQGTGSAGSFPHVDFHADGSPYVGNYKRYATPDEGFLDMARVILKGGKRGEQGEKEIKSAVNKGNLRDAVFTQHANGYFELAPEKYLASVLKNYDILSVNTDWKKVLSEKGSNLLGTIIGLGIFGGIGYGLSVLLRKS